MSSEVRTLEDMRKTVFEKYSRDEFLRLFGQLVVTGSEAAEILCRTKQTVYNHVHSGKLVPFYKPHLFWKQDILDLKNKIQVGRPKGVNDAV